MIDHVCEEFCQTCWEEFYMCTCTSREAEYPEFDHLFVDHAELDSEAGNLPADPMQGQEPVKTKRRKTNVN